MGAQHIFDMFHCEDAKAGLKYSRAEDNSYTDVYLRKNLYVDVFVAKSADFSISTLFFEGEKKKNTHRSVLERF